MTQTVTPPDPDDKEYSTEAFEYAKEKLVETIDAGAGNMHVYGMCIDIRSHLEENDVPTDQRLEIVQDAARAAVYEIGDSLAEEIGESEDFWRGDVL